MNAEKSVTESPNMLTQNNKSNSSAPRVSVASKVSYLSDASIIHNSNSNHNQHPPSAAPISVCPNTEELSYFSKKTMGDPSIP